MMKIKLTKEKINDIGIYDKTYLYWNIGFHYYKKILKLDKEIYFSPEFLFYQLDGSIRYKKSTNKNEKNVETRWIKISKSKIFHTGKRIFNNIKSKISYKICDEWCKHYEMLITTVPTFTGSTVTGLVYTHQMEKLIEGVEYVFNNIESFKSEIPEIIFISSVAATIAALFLKINRHFDKLCKCKKRLEDQKDDTELDNDLSVRKRIKVKPRSSNEKHIQKQKIPKKTPKEKRIENLKMRLSTGDINIKEFKELKKQIEN